MESLASFRQLQVCRRPGIVVALTLALLVAALVPAESRAGARASVRASVTIVDARVGRAALTGAAEIVQGLDGGIGPVISGSGECPSLSRGLSEWSDESGLFSIRLINSYREISTDPRLVGAHEEPVQIEIQFLAN